MRELRVQPETCDNKTILFEARSLSKMFDRASRRIFLLLKKYFDTVHYLLQSNHFVRLCYSPLSGRLDALEAPLCVFIAGEAEVKPSLTSGEFIGWNSQMLKQKNTRQPLTHLSSGQKQQSPLCNARANQSRFTLIRRGLKLACHLSRKRGGGGGEIGA